MRWAAVFLDRRASLFRVSRCARRLLVPPHPRSPGRGRRHKVSAGEGLHLLPLLHSTPIGACKRTNGDMMPLTPALPASGERAVETPGSCSRKHENVFRSVSARPRSRSAHPPPAPPACPACPGASGNKCVSDASRFSCVRSRSESVSVHRGGRGVHSVSDCRLQVLWPSRRSHFFAFSALS